MVSHAGRPRGTIFLNTDAARFEVRFRAPFPHALKDRVKAIAASRWNRQRRCWFVPQREAEALLRALDGHAFDLDDDARAVFQRAAESLGSGVDSSPLSPSKAREGRVISPIAQEAAAYRQRRRAAHKDQASFSFEMGDRVASGAESSASAQNKRAEAASTLRSELAASPVNATYPGVLEIMERARAAVRSAFDAQQWVMGVVQGVTHSRRGHVYFRLVDADPAVGAEQAVLNVAVFGAQAAHILRTLRAHRLTLDEGVTVALRGQVDVYGPRSQLQFIARDIDVRVSRGEVELQRDRVLEALRDEGLSGWNRRHALPEFAERIVLLTSAQGDALHDVLRTLRRGEVGAALRLLDVPVQGRELRVGVLDALRVVEEQAAEIDLVVVVRGGGAANELAWWDDIAVCRAVAKCGVPVIVGIGHERDECALHEVARFEATPTAVAQAVVDHWHSARRAHRERCAAVRTSVERACSRQRRALRVRARSFQHAVERPLYHAEVRLNRAYPQRLHRGSSRVLERRRASLAHDVRVIQHHADGALARWERHVSRTGASLRDLSVRRVMDPQRDSLDELTQQLSLRARRRVMAVRRELALAERVVRAANPERWLRRGYAIVRSADGAVVRQSTQVQRGDRIDIQLASGTLGASVQARALPSKTNHTADDSETA